MKFSVAGDLKPEYGGEYASFTWEDGKYSALPFVKKLLINRDTQLTGECIGVIPSDCTSVNHMRNATSARAIARDLWVDPYFIGDEPQVVKDHGKPDKPGVVY